MNKNVLNGNSSSIRSFPDWIRYTLAFMGMTIIMGFDLQCDSDPGENIGVVWKYEFPTDDGRSSPAIGYDGTIYVGPGDNNLYAINPDGSEKWIFPTGGNISASPAIGIDGTIYIGSYDHNLYAINPDGEEKWIYPTGDTVYSSPAIGSDGTVYIGSDDGYLHAINPDDGEEVWRSPAGGVVRSSPAIGCDGTIYVGSSDHNLYAINSDDGSEKWRYPTNDYIGSSPAIGSDGTVYVGSHDGSLYAINSTDGSKKWRYITDNNIQSSPAIGSDGTIYVRSDNTALYAIDPDGSGKWGYATGHVLNSSTSPAIGNDGTIYVGGLDLYAINSDGTKNRTYDLPDIRSSPAIGYNGILYIVTTATEAVTSFATLYALDVASDRLADTPWPMFRHDLKHTGRLSNAETPTTVNATAGDAQVVISWGYVPGGSAYNIYWSTSPGVTTSDSKISGVTNPYTHTGLTNGTTYYYAITTESACGESALSSEVSATPEIAGPLSVSISPGDGTLINMCPDTTIYTANVTGGASPYFYSWDATHTDGAGFNIISRVDRQTFEACAWDSMTSGTIKVTVTDSNSQTTLDSINVIAF